MATPSFQAVRDAVEILCGTVVAMGLAAYFSMEIRYRVHIERQARRLILASKLPFPPDLGKLRELWQHSGRRDRRLLEEILLDFVRSPGNLWEAQVPRALREFGAFERWLGEARSGRLPVRIQAAIRLGFCPDVSSVQALVEAAGDPSPEMASAAVLSLGRLRDPRGIPGLIGAAARRPPPVPDLTLAAALAAAAESDPVRLVEMLHSPDARLRIIGARALSEVANAAVLAELVESAGDTEAEVRASVCRALARIALPGAAATLRRLARDPVWFVRVRALDALGRQQDREAEALAAGALGDSVLAVRWRAAYALRQIRGTDGECAAKILNHGNRRQSNALVSEWDRAGWLWELVSGLTPRDPEKFAGSSKAIEPLIQSGFTRALASFVVAFPDPEIRLRLLSLLLDSRRAETLRDLAAISDQPACPAQIAAKIRQAMRQVESLAQGVEPRHG